jgi:hypothetical protein
MTDYRPKFIDHALLLRFASDSMKKLPALKVYDDASCDEDFQKNALLYEISQQLEQKTENPELFALGWRGGI